MLNARCIYCAGSVTRDDYFYYKNYFTLLTNEINNFIASWRSCCICITKKK